MQTSDAMRREKAKVRLRRMGGAKRYPSPHPAALMGIAALHPSYAILLPEIECRAKSAEGEVRHLCFKGPREDL